MKKQIKKTNLELDKFRVAKISKSRKRAIKGGSEVKGDDKDCPNGNGSGGNNTWW